MLSITRLNGSTAAIAAIAARSATSSCSVPAVADDLAPGRDHPVDVGGRRREHGRLERAIRARSREPDAVEPQRDQVGERPGRQTAGLGPADRGVPCFGRRAQQRRGVVVTALAGGEPLVELDRARLLEQVDHGVRVGAQRKAGAGVDQGAGRADAVGEVALGRRAEAAAAASAAERGDVGVGEVGGVDGGEALAERSRLGEDLGRRRAVGGETGLVLGGLLGDVGVQRAPGGARPRRRRRGTRRARPRGRCGSRRRPARRRRPSSSLDALGPGGGVAVGEAQLRLGQRLADAAVQVARVEQGDPDPRLAPRRRAAPGRARSGRRRERRRARGGGSGTRRPR